MPIAHGWAFNIPPGRSTSRRSYSKKIDIARSLLEMGLRSRWSIACLLFALAAGMMVFNKLTLCSWMRQKNPAATVSLIGGCLGAAGCLMSPVAWLSKLWWLPTGLDMIGAPYLLVFAWMGIEKCLSRRKNSF